MSHIHALPQGTELVSDFRIEKVLGAGGFGITYLATEIALNRKVTIKEYFPGDFAARGKDISAVPRSEQCAPDYRWGLDRFIEEAQTLARFNHPNIVRVYRYFRANNTGYMVLHFEEGHSLKGWLQSLGRAPRQGELDALIAPLLEALEVVHAAEFLHRDIAPDNIIVRKDGSPVLIDFGAARGDIAQHSRTVSALVKPGYSPYEQYGEIGRQQGPWTDIYALAATLYHAITGKRPPDAPSRVMKDEIVSARDAALSSYRPSFLAAIDQGLRIDIDKRPQSVREWRGPLLAAEPEGQRSWFGGKRTQPADAEGLVATQPVTLPDLPTATAAFAGVAGAVPPPPDVPGRRGRIVDFLDGVRDTPRRTEVQKTPEPAAPAAPAVEAEAPAKRLEKPHQQGGIFRRAPKPQPESKAVVAEDRPVDIQTAPNIAMAKPAKRDIAKRKPPRPRPVKKKSAWRFFPFATKLAVGVVIATLMVRYQEMMPRLELRSSGTVASSPAEAPRTITGSTNRLEPQKRLPPKPQRAGNEFAKAAPVIAEKPIKKAPATLLVKTFEGHTGGTLAVQYADNGKKLVTVGADGTLRVWNAETYGLLRTLELEHGPAMALATEANRALTGHENGRIALWDLETGIQLKSFKRNDAPIHALTFAGRNRFLAGAHDRTVALWETSTQSVPQHVFQGHERDVLAIAFEPGAGLIASGSADRTAKLWSGKSLSLIRTYSRGRDYVTALAFSPDGNALLVGRLSGSIALYNVGNRKRQRRYRGHDGRITSLRFLGGGLEFVSASADGTVRLWNRRDRRAMQTFGSAGARISNAAISPDGRRIAAGKDNGTVQIWNGAVLD